MVPEIQLMLRVERDAMQHHSACAGHDNSALYELIHPSALADRFKRLTSRFTVGNHTRNVQTEGARQCNCAR